MRALFIGGTGNISTACSAEAIRQGIELHHLNRGSTPSALSDPIPTIRSDVRNTEETKRALAAMEFDCVVDWIAFTPEHIENDIELFSGRTKQFIFISSASVYHKPPSDYVISESTPAYNPFWKYSQDKIACERRLVEAYEVDGFPATIVRPSHTYGVGWIPTTFGSRSFTVPKRMLDGRKIVVHGDGQSLWTITHTEDFAVGFIGLMGHPHAVGETFHITSDEQLTWDQIHRTIGHVLGVNPDIVHVASEAIAELAPALGPGLLGDKMYSVVFDNSKVKRFVPGFEARIPFQRGIERSIEWFRSDPSRQEIDTEVDRIIDAIVERYGA
jgi:nucleoside-diphosphate-sugar epimerase